MGLGSEWEVAGSRILWGLVYGVGWVRSGRWDTIMMSTMMISGGWVPCAYVCTRACGGRVRGDDSCGGDED